MNIAGSQKVNLRSTVILRLSVPLCDVTSVDTYSDKAGYHHSIVPPQSHVSGQIYGRPDDLQGPHPAAPASPPGIPDNPYSGHDGIN